MRLFANIISILFHPLLMVTYGIALALTCTYLAVYPANFRWLLVGAAFFSTSLVPGLFILMMAKSGAVGDLELSSRKERVIPYLIIVSSIMICLFFMYRMMMPFWFLAQLAGAVVALIVALGINFYWKISAHAIGIGGLLGGIMGIAHVQMMNPYWAFIAVLLIAGLVGTSRIYLKRHTPMQVYAGCCLGFLCTFVASLSSYIYLFI